jgi:hypothetical protein
MKKTRERILEGVVRVDARALGQVFEWGRKGDGSREREREREEVFKCGQWILGK